MGNTAEAVAQEYKVSREDQDEFAYNSHMKALRAQIITLSGSRVPSWSLLRMDGGLKLSWS